MTIQVKVCGLRRRQDVELCAELGVDAVGFNFWPASPRFILPDPARALAAILPSTCQPVGVFVNADPDQVSEVIRTVGLRAVQLHGDEDVSRYRALPAEIIQVVRVRRFEDAARIALSELADRFLLDAHVAAYGGAGQAFDWTAVAVVRERTSRPILLAGGLDPDNVERAIRTARPDGVDVASGVESAPGIKDAGRLRAFVAAVRQHAPTLEEWL
jgi:phosphoribosylanthranilate isomerase